jgi:hypothetical protein
MKDFTARESKTTEGETLITFYSRQTGLECASVLLGAEGEDWDFERGLSQADIDAMQRYVRGGMSGKKLYLIADGDVTLADTDTKVDGETSVLAYAESEEEALELAKAYDAGKIQYDNVMVNGKTVAALQAQ